MKAIGPVGATLRRVAAGFAGALLALLGLLVPAAPARAQISFVKNIGTNASSVSQLGSTSISVNVSAGGVAAGNSIIVTFAMTDFGGPVQAEL